MILTAILITETSTLVYLIYEMEEATFSCLFNPNERDHILRHFVERFCLTGAFENSYCGSFIWGKSGGKKMQSPVWQIRDNFL